MIQNLDQMLYDQIMLMGDFNGIVNAQFLGVQFVNAQLDRSRARSKGNESKLPKSFFKLVNQEDLEDVWRKCNHNIKDYMFYSASKKPF